MSENKKKVNCILLVDDNEFTNIFNRKFLEKLGVADNIFTVKNGQEALDFIDGTQEASNPEMHLPKPDLIFLDLNMPVMSGWEFIEEYMKLEKDQRKGKIIVLTTSPNPDDEKKAVSVGDVAEYYKKPITKEMMEEILENHF